MFSNTAYEALYQIIGLELHAKFIELITSEAFFKGLILLIFGIAFFVATIKYISRHIPGSLLEKRHVPLSKFIKVIACLFFGLTILRVGADAEVDDYSGNNWAQNSYIQGRFQSVTDHYKVSIVFQLLSKTAEEITGLLSRSIDALFIKDNSQLKAPNFFYKAVMFAGTSSIDDPELRDKIQFYSEECFSKVIPSIEKDAGQTTLDRLFRPSAEADKALADISLELGSGKKSTCLDVKNDLHASMLEYALKTPNGPVNLLQNKDAAQIDDPQSFSNYAVSMALVNYYMDQHEGRLGIQKGAETPGVAGGIFRTLNRVMSWDGVLGLFGLRDAQGAAELANRSQDFSEHLARAPHVAGFVKMVLIFIFPWLMFFVVAGHWRILMIWFWIYFSVLLWTPLWTLLYHIVLGIAMSADVMQAFGNLHDDVSLYSAAIVNSRMYYMFSIYSWAQLLIASATTGSVLMFLKPMLGTSSQEEAPDFIGNSRDVAGAGVGVAQAGNVAEAAAVLL